MQCAHDDCDLRAAGTKDYCVRHLAAAREISVSDKPILTAGAADEKNAKLSSTSDDEVEVIAVPRPARLKQVKARAQAEVHTPDPEVMGARIAELIVAQQQRDARDRAKGKKVLRDPETGERLKENEVDPERVPLKLFSRRKRRDSTMIADPKTGENLVKPGYVGRWVRKMDHNDRPTEQRVVEMEDYGYEIVRTPDGEPLISNLGIAMQAPPEQYAFRVVDKSPPGALNAHERILEETQEMVEQINQRMGDDVARCVMGADHSKETTTEQVMRRISSD